LLPEYRDPGAGRLDPLSVVFSVSSILLLVYGLKQLANHGWHAVPLLAMALGAVIGGAFVFRR
jgi:DHA2 family multidrug resistance protein-like MFS transporter